VLQASQLHAKTCTHQQHAPRAANTAWMRATRSSPVLRAPSPVRVPRPAARPSPVLPGQPWKSGASAPR